MKTATIDLLKKDLLIVELPRKSDVEIFPNSIEIYNQFTGQEETIKGSYTLLGKPDEIKEDDAKELVEQSIHTGLFAHYVKDIPVNTYCYKTAIKSFNSALASEIYWKNPLEEPYAPSCECSDCQEYFKDKQNEFEEAESRTFDRNRTLLLYK